MEGDVYEKYIFDNSIDCKHYIDGEYRCCIFTCKCKEVGDSKSVYFKNISKNTLEKMENAIDEILKEENKK